jgi:hypothetical protein
MQAIRNVFNTIVFTVYVMISRFFRKRNTTYCTEMPMGDAHAVPFNLFCRKGSDLRFS